MVADMWQSTSRQRCSCCLPAPFGACPFALDLTSSIECLHSHCIALYYNNKYNRFGSSCCTQLSCVPCYATSHLLQLPQSPVPAHPSLQASMHGIQHTHLITATADYVHLLPHTRIPLHFATIIGAAYSQWQARTAAGHHSAATDTRMLQLLCTAVDTHMLQLLCTSVNICRHCQHQWQAGAAAGCPRHCN